MISPVLYEGGVGDILKLDCKKEQNVMWYFEATKNNPASYPINSGQSLLIPHIKSHQSGSYFCYGKYVGQEKHFLSRAFVKIYGRRPYIYIILIARVRVQYGKIFYEHAKYFHEPKASENVA